MHIPPASLAVALVVLAGTTACGLLPPPDWVTNRMPLELCGEEIAGHGEEVDAEARRCLFEAFEERRGAELISRFTSVEGDPITRYTRVHENGTVEIFHDATHDRFGSGMWERLRCDRLVHVAELPDEEAMPAEYVFVEDGCESLPTP